MSTTFLNFIAGRWVPARSGRTFANHDPATGEHLGDYPASGPEDVDAAVAAAAQAYESWRLTPAPKRAEIVFRAGEIIRERKEDLARAMTREMGKILIETRGDVQEGIDMAYLAAGEGRRMYGVTTPSEMPNKWAMSVRCPIGVVGVITPWNFPFAIPSWKLMPALVAGNTAVFKPAGDTPEMAWHFTRIFEEAGLPPGVLNLVFGSGSEVGNPMVEHPGIQVISFTGSTETGSIIGATCGRMHKRLSLEMGGKNAMLVMDDADLDLALDGVLWGAFGTTGQRCTASSRLVLHEKIHDRFLQMLCDRAARLRLGPGLDASTDVGPLIHDEARQKVASYVEIARKEGASVAIGGNTPGEKRLECGWFFEPTVFAGVKPGMRVEQEEIFGPALAVLKVGDLDEAIRVNNGVRYGLSSSLYTRDVNAAFRAMADLDNGITYVNAPTIGAEAHLPFGGVKQTGNGHREGGWEVYEFYTETKVIYVDYSGRLQRARIDTYEAAPY